MLTLFYASATFIQSWRINKVCQKITEQLAQKASIAFYSLPSKNDDGFDINFATSPLCTNRKVAKVTEILWLLNDQRGCSLRPVQVVNVTPWVTFPEAPSFLPFSYSNSSESLKQHLKNRRDLLHLLLETDILPSCPSKRGNLCDIIKVENFGKLIAWKVDSKLALIIETDVEYFTKLLIATYLQNNFLINDQLPLLRIESIHLEGIPQPFELLLNHVKKPTRKTSKLTTEEWEKHLEDLRSVNVLASQAMEYQYNKNRTDAKAGAAIPDLIKQEKEKVALKASEQIKHEDETPKSPTKTTAIEEKKPQPIDLPKKPLTISPDLTPKIDKSLAEKTEKLIEAEKITAVTAVTSPVGKDLKISPKKNGEKPKEGSKSARESRFKTSKVSDSPPSKTNTPTSVTKSFLRRLSPSKSIEQPSELEKIAAVTMASHNKASTPTAVAASTPIGTPVAAAAAALVPASLETTAKEPVALREESTAETMPKQPTVPTTTTSIAASTPKSLKPSLPPLPELPKSPVGSSLKTPPKVASTLDKKVTNEVPVSEPAKQTSVPFNPNRPSLKRSKEGIKESKPLNILVYSDSRSARDSTLNTLRNIIEPNMYTIYPLTPQQVEDKHWIENTALLVVCGYVISNIGEILVDYFLHGGKVLSLCSDILHFILPNYRTAEVREHELVQFSYDRWQKVKMMHHIFCYQPSPVKKHFSTDSEESNQINSKKSALVCPRSIELRDLHGDSHNLDVQVLGFEETWNTPSLLLARNLKSGGKALFSQIHLETSPNQFEMDESKFPILKQNESIRLEIFADLLNKYLNINVKQKDDQVAGCIYKQAYFLGRHEAKFELLEKLKSKVGADNVISTPKLTMAFCGKNETPPAANANILPILIHSCPEDFSTVDYFDNLKTDYIGRLVIYAPIVNSTMNVINQLELTNGIVVIAREQSEGSGRSNNQWLSPLGCAMFSIQLHISLQSQLGSRLPLLQHLIGLAMVNTIKSHDIYKVLDISLKWPNDVYANGLHKIGGLIVQTTLLGNNAIVNIGCGINLNNSKPTICINDLINDYNNENHKNLPKIKYEHFLALMFNEIERQVEQIQKGFFDDFYKLYYDLWLHNNQKISIADNNGQIKEATIVGIDECGYLKAKLANGTTESVQPDGNSFDMLKGLIVPKFF